MLTPPMSKQPEKEEIISNLDDMCKDGCKHSASPTLEDKCTHEWEDGFCKHCGLNVMMASSTYSDTTFGTLIEYTYPLNTFSGQTRKELIALMEEVARSARKEATIGATQNIKDVWALAELDGRVAALEEATKIISSMKPIIYNNDPEKHKVNVTTTNVLNSVLAALSSLKSSK